MDFTYLFDNYVIDSIFQLTNVYCFKIFLIINSAILESKQKAIVERDTLMVLFKISVVHL